MGLVLGAGGIAGQAFEAGVLSAIVDHLGWDPRTADVIVGTSAGSRVGALLRANLAPADLFRQITRQRVSPAGARLLARMTSAPPMPPPPPLTSLLRSPVRPPLALVGRTVRKPLSTWLALLSAVVPAGRHSTEPFAATLRALIGDEWPAEPLWICAVALATGERVVFGHDGAPRTDVGTAVGASSAIPGYFEPVVIDGVRYVDGGVVSPTNADLLLEAGLDAAFVLSPMSRVPRTRRRALDEPVRAFAARRLRREVEALRRAGTRVVVFQPTDDDLAVMGINAMDSARAERIARSAYASASRRLSGEHSVRGRRQSG